MIKRTFLVLAIATLSFNSHASLIKKSASGICHAPDSPYYSKLSNFVPFNSLKQCLKTQNARLPKGYTQIREYNEEDIHTNDIAVTTPKTTHKPKPATTTSTPRVKTGQWLANDTKNDEIIKLDYTGFTVWLNCDLRGAEYFTYSLSKDTGNFKRRHDFDLDPKVPKRCQQKSADTYKKRGESWHRGHQAPANNLDDSKKAIFESNYMTNIMPQTGTMNTGAWYQTEYITECYRDISDITIYGGSVWGDDTSNDHFVRSHGVKTPDAFYKIIARHDTGETIAWIVPNDFQAKKNKLDDYLVSVSDIEAIANIEFPVQATLKSKVQSRSWPIPKGCGRG
jgi:endonuclease G